MSRPDYIPSAQEIADAQRSKRSDSTPRELPSSPMAEAGVFGCIFLDPRLLVKVREHFAGEGSGVFFDLRHQVIFKALCALEDKGRAIDVITLHEELRDHGQLDAVGGLDYIAQLPDKVASSANLDHYLEGVWEKHLARQLIQNSAATAVAAYDLNGVNETLLGRLSTLHEEFVRKTQRGAITPQHLKPVFEFAEEAAMHFYGAHKMEAPGYEWPFPFVHKFRKREASLIFGDDGSGKSTVLSYIVVHLLQHPGEKAVVASFEVPPAITLWIMAAQLLGRKAYAEGAESMKTIGDAMAWLNARVVFYDFQGIANWREVRDTFRYAAEKQNATLFTIDNAMRMGIADDDYAQQALAAATLHQFAEDHHAHVFIVLHENKGDGKGKQKIRGSKLWSANMNNVFRIARNEEKQFKLDKAEMRKSQAKFENNEAGVRDEEKAIEKIRVEWDSEIYLLKQRYPGTRQNGSKRVYFDPLSFQFRRDFSDLSVNWLERWKAK
jgi:hypothetical protein